MIITETFGGVYIAVEALEENAPIKGNAIASGDDAHDAEVEAKIQEDLESGNEWAWCCAKVTAGVAGMPDLECASYLGACSYSGWRDFVEGGYYDCMTEESLQTLLAEEGERLPLSIRSEIHKAIGKVQKRIEENYENQQGDNN